MTGNDSLFSWHQKNLGLLANYSDRESNPLSQAFFQRAAEQTGIEPLPDSEKVTTTISALPPEAPNQAYLVSDNDFSLPGRLIFARPGSSELGRYSNIIRAPQCDHLLVQSTDSHIEAANKVSEALFTYVWPASFFPHSRPLVKLYGALNTFLGGVEKLDEKAGDRGWFNLEAREYVDVTGDLFAEEGVAERLVSKPLGYMLPKGSIYMMPLELLGGKALSHMWDWKAIKTHGVAMGDQYVGGSSPTDPLYFPAEPDFTPEEVDAIFNAGGQVASRVLSDVGGLAREFIDVFSNHGNLIPSQAEIDTLNKVPTQENYNQNSDSNAVFFQPSFIPDSEQVCWSDSGNCISQKFTSFGSEKIGVSIAAHMDGFGSLRFQVSTNNPYIALAAYGGSIVWSNMQYRMASPADQSLLDLNHRMQQHSRAQGNFSDRFFSWDTLKHPHKNLVAQEDLIDRRQAQVVDAVCRAAEQHPNDKELALHGRVLTFMRSRSSAKERNLLNNMSENMDEMKALYNAEIQRRLRHINAALKQGDSKALEKTSMALQNLAPHLPETHQARAAAEELKGNPLAAENHYNQACNIASEESREFLSRSLELNEPSPLGVDDKQRAEIDFAQQASLQADSIKCGMFKNRLNFFRRRALGESDQKERYVGLWKEEAIRMQEQAPKDEVLNQQCADACYADKDYKAAASYQELICQTQPDNSDAYYSLSFFRQNDGDKRWVDALQRYTDLTKDPDASHTLINHYVEEGNWVSAKSLLNNLSVYSSKDACAIYQGLDKKVPYSKAGSILPLKADIQNRMLQALSQEKRFNDIDAYLTKEVAKGDCSPMIKNHYSQVKQAHFKQGTNKVVVYMGIFVMAGEVAGCIGRKTGRLAGSVARDVCNYFGIFGSACQDQTASPENVKLNPQPKAR